MKHLAVLLLCLCMGSYPGHAQTPVSAQTSAVLGFHVFVRITRNNPKWDADFDTDGQRIGGLNEADLKTKFTKVTSAASVVNFLTQNGYRVAGFSVVAASHGGIEGYALLFEQRP